MAIISVTLVIRFKMIEQMKPVLKWKLLSAYSTLCQVPGSLKIRLMSSSQTVDCVDFMSLFVTAVVNPVRPRKQLMTLRFRLRLQHLTVKVAHGDDSYDSFTDYRHEPPYRIK